MYILCNVRVKKRDSTVNGFEAMALVTLPVAGVGFPSDLHVHPLQAHFLGQFHSPDFGPLAPRFRPSLDRAAWHKGCKPPGVDRNAKQSTTFRASSP